MIWTYRVFHDQAGYCVRVVLYERDGTLIGYHKQPAVPTGRTAEELAQDIQWLKEAFELPILTMAELDAELAAHPPQPKQVQTKRKTIEEITAELELETPERRATYKSEAVPAD